MENQEQEHMIFAKCEMCRGPVSRDNYQHIGGIFFCGQPSECLTTWLEVQNVSCPN